MFTPATLALGLLAAASTAAATGSAIIVNTCKFNVTVWSVSADTLDLTKVEHTLAPGENHTEIYQKPTIGGVSLKLSSQADVSGPITQFEYTLTDAIWYDVSNVNCIGDECPFAAHGMYLDSGKGCPTRSCQSGEAPCKGAYTAWNDDWNSMMCDSESDINLYVCSSEKPSTQEKKREEFGVPAHRMRRHAHGHPHVRR